MGTLATYRSAIDDQVVQSQLTGTDEKDKAIAKAMQIHSKHRPQEVVKDVTGDGGFDYDLSGKLTSWDDDFSRILVIEYPVDDTDDDKNILEVEAWRTYNHPTNGKELHFLEDTPQTTESFRVTYTARHSCTVSACTVAGADEEAVQALAAALFCKILAAYNAQNEDSTIAADSVDHQSKRREYSAMAKSFMDEYNEHMNIQPGKPKPASATGDWDVNYADGRDRLTHPRRRR